MPVTQNPFCSDCCAGSNGLCLPCRNRGPLDNTAQGNTFNAVRITASGFTGGSCTAFNGVHTLRTATNVCEWTLPVGGSQSIQFSVVRGNRFVGQVPSLDAQFTLSVGNAVKYSVLLRGNNDDCNSPLIMPLVSGAGLCGAAPPTIQADFLPLVTCCPNIIAPAQVRFTVVDPIHSSCLDGLSAVGPYYDDIGDLQNHGRYVANFTTPAGCFLCPPFFFQDFSFFLRCVELTAGVWDSNWHLCQSWQFPIPASYTANVVSCAPFMLTFTEVPFCNGDLVNVVITDAT